MCKEGCAGEQHVQGIIGPRVQVARSANSNQFCCHRCLYRFSSHNVPYRALDGIATVSTAQSCEYCTTRMNPSALAVRRAFQDFLRQHNIEDDAVLDYIVDTATSDGVETDELDELLCAFAPTAWGALGVDSRLRQLNDLQRQVSLASKRPFVFKSSYPSECFDLWRFK